MTITTQKNLLLSKGEYLIDDIKHGKGQEKFDEEGKLIQFGSPDFPDWSAVCHFLKI